LIEAGERLTTIPLPGSPPLIQALPGPGEGFQYWFSTSYARPPAIFGNTVAAVEFTTLIPWLLDEPDLLGGKQMKKAEEIMNRYPNTLRGLAKPPEK
jgi:hypothetical protein